MPQVLVPGGVLMALLRFVSRDDTRVGLNGISFEPAGYAVATDGHALMAARIPAFEGAAFTRHWNEVSAILQGQPAGKRKRYAFTIEPGSPMPDFPTWRRVWPRKLSGKPASFSGELLERVRTARRDTHPDAPKDWEPGPTQMLLNGPQNAALVWLPAEEREKFAYLIMPMRGCSPEEIEAAAKVSTAFGQ